jgi:cell pole-organizing protein PopZ
VRDWLRSPAIAPIGTGMGGFSGINGLADVQARIASIQARFATDNEQSAVGASSSAPAWTQADFASALQSATATSATASANPQRTQFAHDLLSALGAPQTAENVRAIAAWAQAEGTSAAFNPLATTETAPDATNFNGVGVKNYPTYAEGVQATVATLMNGRYSNILAALADGSSAQRVAQAIAQSPWGTGTRVLQVLQSGG